MQVTGVRLSFGNQIRNLSLAIGLLLMNTGIHAQDWYLFPPGSGSRVSSFENLNGVKGKGGMSNHSAKGNPSESVRAGETKILLDYQGAGVINRIWCTVSNRSDTMLRSLRIRMYWDDQSKPAVDVPFGDFFCASLGIPVAFQSELFTNPEGKSFNSYIPMPFRKSAKVTITNESNEDLYMLFYDIDFTTLTSAPENMLYFHACWNRSIRPQLGKDFELLPSVTGRGRFLGVNVGVNVDSAYGKTWWGEGEVKMYLDGDSLHPTINGTGTEDYIGTGWGMGKFTNRFQGCTIADETKSKYAFYRFHIPDPVYFEKTCTVTIQEIGGGMHDQINEILQKKIPVQLISVANEKTFTRLLETPISFTDPAFPAGWVNFYRVDDYSATAYFYLDRPVSNLPALAPVTERIK